MIGNFIKNCFLTALILLIVGTALLSVALLAKGPSALEGLVEDATRGKVEVHFPGSAQKEVGIVIRDNVIDKIKSSEPVYELGDEGDAFVVGYDVLVGKMEKTSLGSDVTALCIDVGSCELTQELSEDENFYLEATGIGKIQGYVEDGVCYVRTRQKDSDVRVGIGWNLGEVKLYVPQDVRFEKVTIRLGAGEIALGTIEAKDIEMEVGAGEVKIGKLTGDSVKLSLGAGDVEVAESEIGALKAEVGMGNLKLLGSITQKADVDCGMGNCNLTIKGAETDFDYDVKCAMGNLQIGEQKYSSVSHNEKTENGAAKEMKLHCSMGNVVVTFIP